MGVFKRKTVKLAKSKSTFKKQFECERYFTIYCFNLILSSQYVQRTFNKIDNNFNEIFTE